ncbi:MAG: TetR/AcrR family transcriptional regulator [Deltaproteobacteria bacterium]|nr:TetR/AcrR family transcriptional regulator [Deltaproteobacteria bacterium]MBW2399378.1 TetR/AcrR family transcriptional regulator [Deltaproteobacteria bacterium]
MPEEPPLAGLAARNGRTGYAKSRQTRARILAAALAEASDSGFHKTSVARIAARAGVAVGNLHYHFGSRRELLRELMGGLAADLMSRLHAADTDDGADFFDRQRVGLLVYLDYARANPAYLRLADEIKLHEPDLYRRAVAGWVERMVTRIRVGIDQGTLRSMGDAEITAQAHFLLGVRHFLEQMLESVDAVEDEAVVDAYLGLVRDGLGRRSRSISEEEKEI